MSAVHLVAYLGCPDRFRPAVEREKMSKWATALTISPITYLFKAFRTFGLKSFEVEGRDILLRALKEPTGVDADGRPLKRRGIVTSKSYLHSRALIGRGGRRTLVDAVVCNHNSVVDDPMVKYPNSCQSGITS